MTSERLILTAAQCVFLGTQPLTDPADLEVVTGDSFVVNQEQSERLMVSISF